MCDNGPSFFLRLFVSMCLSILWLTRGVSNGKVNFSFRGSVNERLSLSSVRSGTLVNPQQQLVDFPEWMNRLYANVTMSSSFKQWDGVLTLRPLLDIMGHTTHGEIFVDNAYLIYRATPELLLTVGKQNLVEGVALNFNPTDFLAEGKEIDRFLPEEEQKQQREGSYVVRLERLYPGWTFSILLAPELGDLQRQATRGIVKLAGQFGQVDGSVFVLAAKDRPGLGLNLAITYGEGLELHAEMALRRGSNRRFLQRETESAPGSGVFQYAIIDPEDDNKFFAQIVVGGHYTFPNTTNIIVEYVYNQSGYNAGQWQSFINLVKQNDAILTSSPDNLRGILLQNLSLENSLLTFRSLRQHYMFFRFNKKQLLWNIEGTMVFFINLNDGSFVVSPRLEYQWVKGFSLSTGALLFQGGQETEFGLPPIKSQWFLQVRKSF
jgi:hypothetical protein